MNYIKYMINRKRLLGIVGGLVDKYESLNLNPSSCKKDLVDAIGITLANNKEELSEWEDHDTDYITIAHNQMQLHASDLLSSGRYHIWAGRLDPMSCASNLRRVIDRCLDYFEARGDLSASEREEYMRQLYDNIRSL